MKPLSLSFLLLLLSLLLSACAPSPTSTRAPSLTSADSVDSLLRAADQAGPIRAAELRVQAARRLLSLNQQQEAIRVLAQTDTRNLPPSLGFEIAQIRALNALQQRDSQQALVYLDYTQLPRDLDSEQLVQLSELRADAFELQADYLAATRELIASSQMTEDRQQQRILHDRIWRELNAMQTSDLQRARQDRNNTYFEQGWFELAHEAQISQQLAGDLPDEWLFRWQEHPAALIPPAAYSQQPETSSPAIGSWSALDSLPGAKRIALALPFSGPLAQVATNLSDGFMTALQTDTQTATQVVTLDTTQIQTSAQLFTLALQQGADWIVGPLERELVNQLANSPEHPLPVLALNQSQSGSNPPFQLELSSEHEIRGLVDYAIASGFRTALIISSDAPWASRLTQTLRQEYSNRGGQLIGSLTYNTQASASEQIRGLLVQDPALARSMPSRSRSGQQVNVSHDSQVIFMITDATDARLIRPMLAYHYAGGIPLLATSHVYEGPANAVRDADLDGIQFIDLPWRITSNSSTREALSQHRTDVDTDMGKFYALGADAYHLQRHLSQLNPGQGALMEGETGRLAFDSQKRITRSLSWAIFRNGVPQPIAP